MKKILKFFPVALAAFALASCSSDDLSALNNGENELTNVDGKLLVQFEGEDGAATTRGGYVTNIYNYNFYSAMAFETGDALKLYHDATSWKPEIWTAKEYGQYKNSTGIEVFDGGAGKTIEASENAYGIYPSTASVFGNENRTSIQYDLSDLAYVEYAVKAKTYAGTTGEGAITKYYNAEFPLWGVKVADAEVMTMKHLAGILRLDVAQIAVPTAANTKAYVIVYSPSKKLTGKIATAADLLFPTPAEELDPNTFMTQTPKLETVAATNAYAGPMTAVPVTEAAVKTYDNLIVMAIDNTVTDKHLMAYLPILPEMAGGDVQVYVTPVQAANATTVDLTAAGVNNYVLSADIISECNDNYTAGGAKPYAGETTVKRGVTYKINDDTSNQNTTAKTPWELASGIIAADKAAYRDFDVYFTQDIEVKNTDTAPQNFYLDLSGANTAYGLAGWDLKHNVTAHLNLKKSSDVGTGKAILFIKTGTVDSKKLTLAITMDGAAPIDSIVFLKDELKSDVELKAVGNNLPAIRVEANTADKLTIGSGTGDVVKTKSNIIIDAPVANPVTTVSFATGATGLKLNNGTITTLSTDNTEKIAANITVESTGASQITTVDYTNIPTFTTSGTDYKYTYYFKSTWDGRSTKTGITEQANIYTVSQLAAANSGFDFKLIGDMDLTANTAWAPLTLTAKKFEGQNKNDYLYTAASTKSTDVKYPTIKGLSAPLFGTIINTSATAAIDVKNFKLEKANIIATVSNQGVLAREVSTAAAQAINITNVDVEDATIDASGNVNIGGLVGCASGTVAAAINFEGCDVSDLDLTGNKYLGGILGYVRNDYPQVAIGGAVGSAVTALCTFDDNEFTLTPTPGVIYDPAYKAVGQFIGGLSRAYAKTATIKVPADKLNAELTVKGTDTDGLNLYSQKGKYGIGTGTVVYYDVVMGDQTVIGYSGYYNTSFVSIISQYTPGSAVYTAKNWTTAITAAYATANTPYLYYINQ